MFRLATSGPEAPFGRSAMSTRNTKPSSITSDSAAISFLPRRPKNSWFDSARWPGPAAGVAVLRVDEDQVDVGRHVQLAAALLAHRQHHHLLRQARFGADRHAVLRHQLVHQRAELGADGEVGQRRHRRHHFGQVGLAVQVARG